MSYFVTDPVGLIIAALNVITVVLLIYVFLQAVAAGQSKLLKVLDRLFGPIIAPLRRILPKSPVDGASIIIAVLLQVIVFVLKRRYL
jgi:uncharacterized protein YggT (Ycf19 family)